MPAKQTKESIEAELNASEIDRIKIKFLEVLVDLEEMEKELRDIEAARGLPVSNQLKTLPERMAAVGMRKEGIERVTKYLDAFETINASGGIDRLRADVKRELAARADAELTGAELLAGIIEKHRKA